MKAAPLPSATAYGCRGRCRVGALLEQADELLVDGGRVEPGSCIATARPIRVARCVRPIRAAMSVMYCARCSCAVDNLTPP